MSRVTSLGATCSGTFRLLPWTSIRAVVIWAPAAALVLFLTFAVRAGLPVSQAMWGLITVATTQLLPGVLVWRCLRPRAGWWFEDVVMGLALGASLAVGAQTIAGLTGAPWIALVPGPTASVVLAVLPATRKRIRDATSEPLPVYWGPFTAGVSLLLVGVAERFYRLVPYGWDDGFRATYLDMPFHLALVGQLAHRGPIETPHVASEALMYHWFSHAWMAQISTVGIETDAVTLRFAPALLSVAVVSAIAIAAVRLSGRPWTGPVAALLAVAAGDVDIVGGVTAGTLVNHLSPSLGFSALVLIALVVVLGTRWHGAPNRGRIFVVALLAFTTVGSKASALSVVVAGAAFASVVTLVTKHERRRQVAVDLAVLVASWVMAYFTVFASSTRGLAFDPSAALEVAGPVRHVVATLDVSHVGALIAVAALLIAAVMARGVGLLAALAVPELRRDPMMYFLFGVGLAGACAVVLFSHPGQSQFYFLRNAAPALAIGSAIGLAALTERIGHRPVGIFMWGGAQGAAILLLLSWARALPIRESHTLLFAYASWATVLAAALAGSLIIATYVVRGTRRPALLATFLVAVLTMTTAPVITGLVDPELPAPRAPLPPDASHAFSADQIHAARWLRNNSGRRDLVMTNRHCGVVRSGDPCDSRRFFVTAYTERRILVEGWAYTPTWSRSELPTSDRSFWNPDLLALNDRFLEAPTPERAARVRDLGVQWIYVDKTAPHSESLDEFAESRFETEWAWVLEFAT